MKESTKMWEPNSLKEPIKTKKGEGGKLDGVIT